MLFGEEGRGLRASRNQCSNGLAGAARARRSPGAAAAFGSREHATVALALPVTSTHTPFVCPLALPPQTTSKATQPRRERVALFFWRLGKKFKLCHVLSHWKCPFGYLPTPTTNASDSASETPDPPFLPTQFAIRKITADSEQKNLFCFFAKSTLRACV